MVQVIHEIDRHTTQLSTREILASAKSSKPIPIPIIRI
jgi:hypothetical protein